MTNGAENSPAESSGIDSVPPGMCDREVGEIIVRCPAELVFKLLLNRGKDTRNIHWKAELFSSRENLRKNRPSLVVDKTRAGGGKMEASKPPRMGAAKWAKIIFLDDNSQEINEGLILKLEPPENIGRPDAAAQRMRNLGFYKQPALIETAAGDLEGQKYLDFFLALAGCLRSLKSKDEEIGEFKPEAWQVLDEQEYWDYNYRGYDLPDPKFTGEPPDKVDVFRLRLLRGDKDQSGDVYVRIGSYVVPETELENGTVEVKIPRRLASAMKWAHVYRLDEDGKLDGRGLSLKLETADMSKAPDASQRLRALGFYRGSFPGEGGVSDLKGQSYLDFFLASVAWVRAKEEGPKDIDDPNKIAENTLDADDYWKYEHLGYKMPEPEFEESPLDEADVFRLRLLRGDDKLDGEVYVKVGSYVVPDTELVNGTAEIKVPKRLGPKASLARVYWLDGEGELNGQGLSLKLESADMSQAQDASQRLRAMGFYRGVFPGEGSVSDLQGQSYLDFFLASVAWVRAKEDGSKKIEEPDKIAGEILNSGDYWKYEHQGYKMPEPEFEEEALDEADVFRLKLLRGDGDQSGDAVYIRVGSYVVPDTQIQEGIVEIKVPKRLGPKAKMARVYWLDEEGELSGQGLRLKLEDADMSQAPDASKRLRALGFYRGAFPGETGVSDLQGQSYLDFFLASVAWVRAKEDGSKEIDESDKIAENTLDADDYWGYSHQGYEMPDPRFTERYPEEIDVFRLRLLRGDDELKGEVYVRVGSYIVPSAKLVDGAVEIKTPKRLGPKAKVARVYWLDEEGELNGQGLRLKLEDADMSQAPDASQRLRALGFYRGTFPGEGSVSGLQGQSYLDFFLASVAWVRAKEDGPKNIDESDKIADGPLDADDYWKYGHEGYEMPYPIFTERPPEEIDIFRLRLLRGDDKLDGEVYVKVGSYIVPDAKLVDGTAEIKVPGRLGPKAKVARVYWLDEEGELSGQGLSLKLEDADMSQAPDASQRLRALGFYRGAFPGEGSVSDLQGQSYLDFFLASIAWMRAQKGDPNVIENPDKIADGVLNADNYWLYDYQGHKMPEPKFKEKSPEEVDVFRLKLLRGDNELKGKVYVRVGSYIVPDAEIRDGLIEIKVPKRLALKAKLAHIYRLDERGEISRQGLSLKLETADVNQAPAAVQRLRAMGFYQSPLPAEVSVSAITGRSYLNFFIAWIGWFRVKSGGQDEVGDDPASLAMLNQDDYWQYQPKRYKLSEPDFENRPAVPREVIEFRLKQIPEDGLYELATDYNLTSEIEVKDSTGVVSLRVPSRLASKIRRARLYNAEKEEKDREYIGADKI